MSIFTKDLPKNLILFLIIFALAGLFGLILLTDQALADNSQNIKQVKTATSPVVYYLDYSRGLRKAYVSERAFLSYGNKWPDIKIISQEELNKWPEMNLAKTKDSNQVYYISQGQKALILSERQFMDSGFKWADIMTLSPTDLAEYKSADFKVGGGIGDQNNNQLSISLDPSSPKAGTLIMGTEDNLAAVFNLRAQNQPVEIKKIVLNLAGIFNPDLIDEIYLTNERDVQLSPVAAINNRQAVFDLNERPLAISSGESKKIKVYVNFKETTANIINHTFQVAINQAASLTGAKAIGAFPVAGETFKLTFVAGYLEKVTAREQSLNINNNQAIIGSTEKNIGKFILTETSGRADIFVKELRFSNQGSAGEASLSNLKLKNKGGQVVAITPSLIGNRELIFKLDNYKIKKGGSETFTVIANIAGGPAGEDASINLHLEKTKVKSSQGNYNILVSITNLNENIIIKRASLGVVAKELKANNKVFTKETGVIIGVFEIRNNNQKLNLDYLSFSLEKGAATPALSETVYLVDFNTGDVYGYFNGDRFNSGEVNVNSPGVVLTPKLNLTVALVTKIPDNSPNGGFYRVILKGINYRVLSNAFFHDTVNITGTKLIVSRSNLYLYPNNEQDELAFIKGEKNVKIASFIIEGAAGGDTRITDLTFSRGLDSSGVISYDNGFSNLRFYIGSKLIKIIKFPYSGDLALSGFSYVLKSGQRAEIKVQADTERELRASEVQLAISDMAAVNDKSGIPALVNNLNVNSRKVSFGQVAVEISQVANGFVTQGEDDNVIAGFKVKNTGDEDLKLGSITINAADQELTYSLGYSNLRIVDRGLQRNAGSMVSRPVAGANKISLGGYILKAGEEAVFDVHVKASSLIVDQNVDIYFSDFTAQGKISKVNATVSGDATESHSFTVVRGQSGQSAGGTAKTLIKPVRGSITYGWHDRSYPFRNVTGEHTGIDIITAQGTPVKAAADGVVVEVVVGLASEVSYITISHNDTLVTKYAHLSRVDVRLGDRVKRGEIIGLSGGTPGTPGAGLYTNGAHLHFEVILNGASVDPERYL